LIQEQSDRIVATVLKLIFEHVALESEEQESFPLLRDPGACLFKI
jgi:hypothetical protein